MAPTAFKREWECSFDAAEGLVYGDVFDAKFHVREPPADMRWSEILIGGDHGWEDPGVLLKCGVAGYGRDAIVFVLDEVYEQHKADSWWAAKGGEWFKANPSHKFYPDPSRPGLIEDYKRAGAHVQDVDNAIEDGVSSVADRLVVRCSEEHDVEVGHGTNCGARIYVSPKCEKTIREFGTYRRKRDPKNLDRFLDDIVDKDNHAMDALRYVILSRFGKPTSECVVEGFDDGRYVDG